MLLIDVVGRGRTDYYLPHGPTEPDLRSTLELRDPTRVRAERVGFFGGSLARRFGIAGSPVTREVLESVLSGRDPRDDALLDKNHHLVRNVAFDCLFVVPKSVSLLHALGDDSVAREVLAAHEAARDAVLELLEDRAAFVRTSRRLERHCERADGLGWAVFVHPVSRNGDPHLHSHVLVWNLVASEARGFSSLDAAALFAEKASASQLYLSHLRAELACRLGVDFRDRAARGSDVAGFSDSVIDAFSTRRAEIRGRATGPGRSARSRTIATREGRPDKGDLPGALVLEARWRNSAEQLGLPLERTIARIRGAVEPSDPSRERERFSSVLGGLLAGATRPMLGSELLCQALRESGAALTVPTSLAVFEETVERLGRLSFDPVHRRELGRRSAGDRRQLGCVVTEPVLDAIDRWEAVRRDAFPLDCSSTSDLASGELLALDGSADAVSLWERLQSIGRSGPIVALAPSLADAEAFTAATGLAASTPKRRVVLRGGAALVLVEPDRMEPVVRLELVERARRVGSPVVLVNRGGGDGLRPAPIVLPRGGPEIGGSPKVVVVRRPGELATVASRLVSGEGTGLVVPELLQPLFGSLGRPPKAWRRDQLDQLKRLVVVGGRSPFPPASGPACCIHLVVAPPELAQRELEVFARGIACSGRSSSRTLASPDQILAAGWRELRVDRGALPQPALVHEPVLAPAR